MAAYTVVNGTNSELTNINAGGVDVDPFSYRDGVTLTDPELAALLDGTPKEVAAIPDLTAVEDAQQIKRVLSIASQYPHIP